jgi:hypothetical protein
MIVVGYGLGAVMVIAGIVLVAANPGGFGVDGFAMAVGGGLAVLLINVLFRLSVSSNDDREREEQARRYLDEHGVWPEEEEPPGRRWTLPQGIVTPEDEQRDGALRAARDSL